MSFPNNNNNNRDDINNNAHSKTRRSDRVFQVVKRHEDF